MKKVLNIDIMESLAHFGCLKGICFKDKYFFNEDMTHHLGRYWIPSTVGELLTVLPKKIYVSERVDEFIAMWQNYSQEWQVGYRKVGRGNLCSHIEKEKELVDALGKLLIWCIKEGRLEE